MPQINTIIFDLGGVLIDWDPMSLYKKAFQSEKKAKWFLENVCHFEWNMQMDAGKSFGRGIAEKSKEFPEYEEYIRMYYDRWEEMLVSEIHETVALFGKLKKQSKYKLYAITNWSAETFPIALNKYKFLHEFDGIAVSGIIKKRKPFPEIYKYAIKKFRFNPSEAIFIDDNPANVEAAITFGFYGIHYKNSEQLSRQLFSLGVIF